MENGMWVVFAKPSWSPEHFFIRNIEEWASTICIDFLRLTNIDLLIKQVRQIDGKLLFLNSVVKVFDNHVVCPINYAYKLNYVKNHHNSAIFVLNITNLAFHQFLFVCITEKNGYSLLLLYCKILDIDIILANLRTSAKMLKIGIVKQKYVPSYHACLSEWLANVVNINNNQHATIKRRKSNAYIPNFCSRTQFILCLLKCLVTKWIEMGEMASCVYNRT